jgi:hypothetical protein
LLCVSIPLAIKSGNLFINQPAWKYKKYRDNWFGMLNILITKIPIPAKKRRKLVIIRHCKRYLDEVNFFAGCKPVEDWLVDVGWIMDDSIKYCEIYRGQEKKSGVEPPMTTLKIYEGTGPDLKPLKKHITIDNIEKIKTKYKTKTKTKKGNLWTMDELKKRGLI